MAKALVNKTDIKPHHKQLVTKYKLKTILWEEHNYTGIHIVFRGKNRKLYYSIIATNGNILCTTQGYMSRNDVATGMNAIFDAIQSHGISPAKAYKAQYGLK